MTLAMIKKLVDRPVQGVRGLKIEHDDDGEWTVSHWDMSMVCTGKTLEQALEKALALISNGP